MKKKTKIIIVLIIAVLIGTIFFIVWNNQKNDKMKKLTSFDITVISYVDLMPTWPENNNPKEAYFKFNLVGITKDEFLNEYEIMSIELNDCLIKCEDIMYENDDNGFRFYSPKYKFKGNNIINLIIKNKKTNVEYTKRLKVSTGTAL